MADDKRQSSSVVCRPSFVDSRLRWFLLFAILLAFARLVWRLDAKTLWWDESLSLQRIESGWLPLLMGKLAMTDGVHQLPTRDQHPFFYFIVLDGFVRLFGDSEYALRLPSVFAGTLLAPSLWAFARLLVRLDVAPETTPLWGIILAAVNPFFLWYGQEARSYILWSWLAVLSTYALLRWSAGRWQGRVARTRIGPWLAGYACLLLLLLVTHYFSVLLAVVHGIVLYSVMRRRRPGLALLLLILWGLVIAGMAGGIAWVLLSQPGVGSNFRPISFDILARDLLNAFSLGLSVNIEKVWPLDVVFGGLALLGAAWGLRRARIAVTTGWITPAFVLIPTLILFAANLVQPVYMNARHLALVSGGFLLLVAAGLGVIARSNALLAAAVTALLVGASGYSTVNYFTLPQYRKGPDMATLGADLAPDLQDGDLVLLDPPFAWRFFRYYLPLDLIERAASSAHVGWRAVPLVGDGVWNWNATYAALDRWRREYRRIWLVTEGTHPYLDPNRAAERWLQENTLRVGERAYFSPNAYLELDLFLTAPPIQDGLPASVTQRPDVTFGDRIVLRGYAVGEPLTPDSFTPVTLYWDPLVDIQRRYKYILWVEAVTPDGQRQVFPRTEQEPYRGSLPTTWWRPGPLIEEFSNLTVPPVLSPDAEYTLHVAWYDAETLDRLPITEANGAVVAEGGTTLVLPFAPRD